MLRQMIAELEAAVPVQNVTRVGLIGCGDISDEYVRNAVAFDEFEIVACADLDSERARAAGVRWGVESVEVDALLDRSDVEVVLNLTPPAAHASVARSALSAGKHVYTEKPMAIRSSDALELAALADAGALQLVSAPDTFLAPTFQTARAMINGGDIGDAVSVTMTGLYEPPEVWHPDPRFLYAPGGGPLFDMGPYFLHVLFDLLGSVVEVCAMTATDPHPRIIGAGSLAGQAFQAGTPTSVAAGLQLAGGAIATLHVSFDVRATTLPFIEIHGSKGTLVLPDPEQLEGQLRFRAAGTDGWRDIPTASPTARHARGVGLADLAGSLRGSPVQRLTRDFGLHAVEVMEGILSAGNHHCSVQVASSLST